jgi:predicted secreted protein
MSKNGTQVLLSLEASVLVGQVTSGIDFTFDMIETTVKSSAGRSKTYETGENGGTLSCESQLKNDEGTAQAALYAAAKAGTAQAFLLTTTIVGDVQYAGSCLISGISISAPKNDVRTISYSLQITGEITVTAIAA